MALAVLEAPKVSDAGGQYVVFLVQALAEKSLIVELEEFAEIEEVGIGPVATCTRAFCSRSGENCSAEV